jgi:hypothetical protein
MHSRSNPAKSEALNATSNEAQERSNKPGLSTNVEQVSTACYRGVGLSEKQMPVGKPQDKLTQTR